MINYYAAAPIVTWVYKDGKDFSRFIKESHKTQTFSDNNEPEMQAALILASIECSSFYHAAIGDDVKKTFSKYDTDGSGSIDKDELAVLCKELGCELDEDQLEEALIDLDLNKDGVIDFDEFSRWYFTGMKPYNGTRRSMLKIGKHTASVFNALAEKTR